MGQGKQLISVIVPAYGCSATLGRCLEGLFGSAHRDFECIVVDDASPDDFSALLKPFPVKLLKLEKRSGPAFARNRGAEAAAGEILFFLDSDVRPRPETLGLVAAFFEKHADVSAVFGSYDDEPGEPGFLSQYRNLFHHYTHQVSREKAMTFWAGCGAVRKEAFRSVGGFDEHYTRPCVEDIALGYRLNRAGYEVRLEKTIQATHLKRWTFVGILRSDIFDRALPWTALLMRQEKLANDLNITVAARVGTLGLYAGIACLAAAVVWPLVAIPGLLLVAGVILLNGSVYGFYLRKRGLWFALRAIPMHLLYLFYGGLAFAAGSALYKLGFRKDG
ncbi:MAG: glycosyl transferase [Verrucomicrobia bacterium]|nr:glycosyl transferase [Verrucomicrobiota bacterium]